MPEVVSGFGIALLTTAVGVVMRFGLNPPRVDLIEEEQAAFHSIRHYYDMMHRDHASLTATNKQLALEMKVSLDEFRKSFHDGLRAEAEARTATTLEITEKAEGRLVERLAELEAASITQLGKAVELIGKEAEGATELAVTATTNAAKSRLA